MSVRTSGHVSVSSGLVDICLMLDIFPNLQV